jgi:hypothetical protein
MYKEITSDLSSQRATGCGIGENKTGEEQGDGKIAIK